MHREFRLYSLMFCCIKVINLTIAVDSSIIYIYFFFLFRSCKIIKQTTHKINSIHIKPCRKRYYHGRLVLLPNIIIVIGVIANTMNARTCSDRMGIQKYLGYVKKP